MKVGYARVSTKDQDLKLQLEALVEAGCERVFHGKQSGVSAENEQMLKELIDFVREGDVIAVTKLDRLGRSLKAILQVIEGIHSKKASLRTLDGAIDTSSDSPFSTAMISLIATFAQLERDLIVSRTSEGREAAKRAGKKMGRKRSLSDEDQRTVKAMLKLDKSTVSELARRFSTSRTTIQRLKKEI